MGPLLTLSVARNEQTQDRDLADLKKRMGAVEQAVGELVKTAEFKRQSEAFDKQKADRSELQQVLEELALLRDASSR